MKEFTFYLKCPNGKELELEIDEDGFFTSPSNDLDKDAIDGLLSFADNKETILDLKRNICNAANKAIREEMERSEDWSFTGDWKE